MFLWPRQEVLQLILPQIAGHGKALTYEHVIAVVRKLIRNQTPEGLISFDRWLVAAKDVLKWNDSVISLFWEMLLMATWHSKDPAERVNFKSSWSDGGVDTYFLSIFLALHVDDSPHGVSSNKHNFDAFWPAQYVDRDEPILSTVSSMTSQRPTTPSKHLTAPPSTPQSPRSPKSNPSPQSPKRSTTPTGSLSVQHGTPHQVRSSAQHLYSLKQKLPFILKVLSTDEVLDDINRSPINDMDEPIINPTRSAQEFVVSRQALDSLGLILSGGTTRAEESKSKLSNLHSLWSSDDMNNSFESSGRREGVCFSELSMWIDDLLVMNDVLYPTSSGAATGPRMSHVSLGGVGLVTGADARTLSTPRGMSPRTSYEETGSPRTFVERLPQPPVVHNPLRHIMSSSSIHANLPSVVRHFASTLLYTTAASSDNSGQIPPSSSDTSLVDIDRMRTSQDDLKELLRKESKSVDQKASSSSTSSSSSNLSVLPQALITGCVGAHLYLLSSYSTATISSSHDCEIVIGAVAGAIILSACERVTLTVACRKLVVVGCLDCKINVASMSANVITGECRGLLFSPFNTAYKSHRSHLIAAGLGSLTVEDSSVTSVARDGFKSIAATGKEQRSDSSWSDGTVNCWSVLHDVSSCLESPITSGSPSGYALDAASTHTMMSIPPPPINVACHLPYERLQQIAIPSTEEYLELKAGAIALPPLYLRSTLENNIKLNRIRDQLVQYSQSHSVTDNETSSSGKAFGSDNTMECDSQPTSAKVLSISSNVPSQRSDTVTESGTSEHVKKAGPSIPGLKLTSLPHSEEMHSSLPAVPSLSLLPPTFNKAFLDWLAATGRTQQLLELIRLDAGTSASQEGYYHATSMKSGAATFSSSSSATAAVDSEEERHLPRALNLENISLGGK